MNFFDPLQMLTTVVFTGPDFLLKTWVWDIYTHTIRTVHMRHALSCNCRSSAGTENTREIQTAELCVELFERPVFLGLQSPKVPKAVWWLLCGTNRQCGRPKAFTISPGTSSTCCATWALTCPTTPSCLPRSCDWARVSWKRWGDARVGWYICYYIFE